MTILDQNTNSQSEMHNTSALVQYCTGNTIRVASTVVNLVNHVSHHNTATLAASCNYC